MAYQGTFAAGATLTASDLNGYGNVTIAKVSNVSVPNSTNTTIAFDTEIVDVDGWFAPTSTNITPDITGIYLITCNVVSLDSNNRGLVNVQVGGATIASEDQDGGRDFSVAVHASVTSGQNINAIVFQNSGSTQTPDVTLGVQLIRAT
jgi:flagellar basal body rod protein FlgF